MTGPRVGVEPGETWVPGLPRTPRWVGRGGTGRAGARKWFAEAVFDSLRTGLDPSIAAVATFLMVPSTGAVPAALYLRQPRREQS